MSAVLREMLLLLSSTFARLSGDKYLKPYVISDPEVTITDRTDGDECLILASDGLWDVLPNEVVCEIVRKCLSGRLPSEGTCTLSKDGEVGNLRLRC